MSFKTVFIAFFALSIAIAGYSSAIYLKEFTFNETDALAKWGKMVLDGQVEYKLLKAGDNGFVQALSEKAASALYYRVGYDVEDYPVLSWKWRVLKFPDTSAAKTDKERDDYAARVYVIFPFLNFSTSKFIEYVWSENEPVGTVITSPSGDNVKMIVARSGRNESGEWASETRNVYEDYLKVFGEKPGLKAGAVAIMCDADSSNTTAESVFDDIAIMK